MARKTLIQVRRDTAANWTSANPTLSAGEPGFETDTGKVKFGDGSTAWTSLAYVVTDAKMVTSDITTNDVSTSKHGFVPKAPNDTAKFLRGDGTWAAVGGVTTVIATDVFWDAVGDLAVGTGADAAARLPKGNDYDGLITDSSTTTDLRWVPGASVLLYDYTVAGSDKASIDTGADTPDAGIAGTSAFPTGFRTLEVFFTGRTDEAVAVSSITIVANNDTASTYSRQLVQGSNATAAASRNRSTSAWTIFDCAGASALTSQATMHHATFHNYGNTTFLKSGILLDSTNDSTAGNNFMVIWGITYESTNALTRLKWVPTTAAKKFKVGTRVSIYAR